MKSVKLKYCHEGLILLTYYLNPKCNNFRLKLLDMALSSIFNFERAERDINLGKVKFPVRIPYGFFNRYCTYIYRVINDKSFVEEKPYIIKNILCYNIHLEYLLSDDNDFLIKLEDIYLKMKKKHL